MPQAGEDAAAVVDPRSITLYRSLPDGSARNLLHGEIVHIIPVGKRAYGSVRVTVLIDALSLPLTAEVTSASVRHLDLQEGLSIYATFKALEAQAYTG